MSLTLVDQFLLCEHRLQPPPPAACVQVRRSLSAQAHCSRHKLIVSSSSESSFAPPLCPERPPCLLSLLSSVNVCVCVRGYSVETPLSPLARVQDVSSNTSAHECMRHSHGNTFTPATSHAAYCLSSHTIDPVRCVCVFACASLFNLNTSIPTSAGSGCLSWDTNAHKRMRPIC
jgi:hypothetical protein